MAMDQNRTQLVDSTQNKNSRTVDKTVYRGFYNLKPARWVKKLLSGQICSTL